MAQIYVRFVPGRSCYEEQLLDWQDAHEPAEAAAPVVAVADDTAVVAARELDVLAPPAIEPIYKQF